MATAHVVAVAILCVCSVSFGSLNEEPIPEDFSEIMPIADNEMLVQNNVKEQKLDPKETRGHAMFLPKNWKIPKVPAEAGNKARFHREAKTQSVSATQALGTARVSDEQARGLSIVTSIMKKREAAENIKHEGHVVAQKMNFAAEEAAKFKESVAKFDREKVVVQKAELEVKAQEAVVAGFKKQLHAAAGLLKKKKSQLHNAQQNKLHAKYLMEVSAHAYKSAKAVAIKLDRKAQERRAKTKQMRYYAKVAEKAVEAAEHSTTASYGGYGGANKHAKKHAKKLAKKASYGGTKPTTNHKGKKCSDCKTLPKAYLKQMAAYSSGGKKPGSCKDCGMWAANGHARPRSSPPS